LWINLENYNKVPVIGKVLEKRDNEFTIHYWKGSWKKNWEPWLHSKGPWTDVLSKEYVYLADFTLNEGDKLCGDTKRLMKSFLNGGQNK
jgi:mannosyltransferase OCH1-like enzyme